jgi:fluoride exporter
VQLILVGLGGFAGAVLRWSVDGWISERNPTAFPFGTLFINLTGSFVLGVMFAWVLERNVLPPDVRLPLMVGFLGAYTTFSTFMLESWRLAEEGAYALAFANLAGSVLLGLVAVVAGLAVGRLLP